ncbi:MAG: HAMP domain-containing sensor histidine kinase [Cyanobacteria bacterium J06588_5]
MGAPDQLLPTISALVALGEFAQGDQLSHTDSAASDIHTVSDRLSLDIRQQRAKREWQGAVAALNQLLSQQLTRRQPASERAGKKSKKISRKKGPQALVLSGPVPLLEDPTGLPQLSNWTFVPPSSESFTAAFSALSPVERILKKTQERFGYQQPHAPRLLPLLEDDPLSEEQFACVLTPEFSLVLVLGEDADGELSFQFSFMPEVVNSVWRMLRSRIIMIRPQQLEFVETLVEKFEPKAPDYRIVSQFNRWMLACLPQPSPSAKSNVIAVDHASSSHQGSGHQGSGHSGENSQLTDSEFLKAMAHEIRTPLTTIRTYTRSLLKRKDLNEQVIKRLNSIDRECTQQIDRFSLIFRAVELEAASQSLKSPLSAISLHQVFQEAIPQWQQASHRRNLSLEVGLPPDLPMVASDPTMLQHVLTGLVELFTHSVSPGSHIQLHVLHAGEQLKLQFQSQADPNQPNTKPSCEPPPLQSLGHLLMFQPDTGGLSLNLEATKNLFHALGAKLTVRERSNQGTTWTVFLPMETSGLQSYPIV